MQIVVNRMGDDVPLAIYAILVDEVQAISSIAKGFVCRLNVHGQHTADIQHICMLQRLVLQTHHWHNVMLSYCPCTCSG